MCDRRSPTGKKSPASGSRRSPPWKQAFKTREIHQLRNTVSITPALVGRSPGHSLTLAAQPTAPEGAHRKPHPAWPEQHPPAPGWLQENAGSRTRCPGAPQQRGDADTHLHGPHQSVCWLRPKRALHFLGEAGSEHRSMRGEEWARQRRKEEEEQEEEKRQHHFSHFNTRLTDYNSFFCSRTVLAPPLLEKSELGTYQ